MNTFKIHLRILSALGTPLAADTLWGHVAWGIRYSQGESFLSDWLQKHEQDCPPLVLSNPMPKSFFPRPFLPISGEYSITPTRAAAQQLKQLSKYSWISESSWQKVKNNCTGEGISEAIAEDIQRPNYPRRWLEINSRVRIGVHRFTGGTQGIDGGTLFDSDEWFFASGNEVTVWAASTESQQTIREWLEAGLTSGYGRDASAGLGRICVDCIESESLPCCPEANAAVVLGCWIPRKNEPCRGFIRTKLRHGRLGGEFALSSIRKQKYPVRFIDSGSVVIGQITGSVVGRLHRGVHPELTKVAFPGQSLVVPVKLDDVILGHALLNEAT